jgi:hypothetical protein
MMKRTVIVCVLNISAAICIRRWRLQRGRHAIFTRHQKRKLMGGPLPALLEHFGLAMDQSRSLKHAHLFFFFIYICNTNKCTYKSTYNLYCFVPVPTCFGHTLAIFRAYILVSRVRLKMCSSPYNVCIKTS